MDECVHCGRVIDWVVTPAGGEWMHRDRAIYVRFCENGFVAEPVPGDQVTI